MKPWKIIQRQTYDILSHKYSLLIVITTFTTIIVSAIQFGEILVSWSQDKYYAMFTSFSDNIGERSFQTKLCQYVPIDAVYTWVNGSDPVLLNDLREYRNQLQDDASKNCHFRDCVPSHFAAFRGWLGGSVKSSLDLEGIQMATENWTLVRFPEPQTAALACSHPVDIIGTNSALYHAHWTSDSNAPGTYAAPHTLLLVGTPLVDNVESLIREMLRGEDVQVFVHDTRGIVAVTLSDSNVAMAILRRSRIVHLAGVKFTIHRAYLLLQLPSVGHPRDFAASRFEDKDELRYSLRSLSHAPWIRRVYLVTNGQIPHWLDLDNSRLTLVTHREIFPNPEHLPTFSSAAIESHLHRIPGLSPKFLYLNDDVMLGRDVWPEDFITHSAGQKVYLSWGVPDCNLACPWAWVGDGSCDPTCNSSACFFDNGDCDSRDSAEEGEDDLVPIGRRNRPDERKKVFRHDDRRIFLPKKGQEHIYQHNIGEEEPYIEQELPIVNRERNDENDVDPFAVMNNEDRINQAEYEADEAIYKQRQAKKLVRSASNPKKNVGDNNVKSRSLLHFNNNNTVNRDAKNISVSHNISEVNRNINSSYVNAQDMHSIHYNSSSIIIIISSSSSSKKVYTYTDQNITSIKTNASSSRSGFKIKDDFVQPAFKENESSYVLRGTKQNQTRTERLSQDATMREEINLAAPDEDRKRKQREEDKMNGLTGSTNLSTNQVYKSLDTFAESLLYVNQLFNSKYGFQTRKVPAHMPHLVDTQVMQELQDRFPDEWLATSSHRVRDPRDMQFAFSYFYFLMSETTHQPIEEIFHTFDTDLSRTLSDRELRTLLTRLYETPLGHDRVQHFEQLLVNCSVSLPPSDIQPPPYERYEDSKMPVVTLDLVKNCPAVVALLSDKFGSRHRFQFELVRDSGRDVSFTMLSSNLTQLVQHLDQLRRDPRKFICLNDNLDPRRESDNVIARAVLQDLYESLYPLPSVFELAPHVRNRFLHADELATWRRDRARLRAAIYLALSSLLVFTVASFLQIQCPRHLFGTKRSRLPARTEQV